jgi:hypothetical protein
MQVPPLYFWETKQSETHKMNEILSDCGGIVDDLKEQREIGS